VEGAVLLFFPLWVVKLLWEQVKSWTPRQPATAQAAPLVKKERWLTGKKVGFLLAPLLILPVFEWAVDSVARNYLPLYADRIFLWSNFAALVVLAVVLTPVLLEGIHEPAPSAASGQSSSAGESVISRRKWKSKLTSWLATLIFLGVLISPVSWLVKIAIFATALIYPQALLQLKRWTFGLTVRGDYDRALRLNRMWVSIPFYGDSLEGLILVIAGRYKEGLASLKPLAFDKSGQPRLTSNELYAYALALSNEGEKATAQQLYEAAILVPQRSGVFHSGLAACLLEQNKEPELMEQVLATWQEPLSTDQQRANQAHRIAKYAWALASCGRHDEAEARLQEAFAGSVAFGNRDLAVLQSLAGETWRALGDLSKARIAFQDALTICPNGDVAAMARKRLAELGES
jgi:tetratricopeptide (TPR) repeat protein